MKTNNPNTIAYEIKQMLNLRPMRRIDIVRYLVESANGKMTDEQWNAVKHSYRGYYSDAFKAWRDNGTVEVIDGLYHVTDACNEERVGLWTKTKEKQIKDLERRHVQVQSNHVCGRDARYWYERYLECAQNKEEIEHELDELKSALATIKRAFE